MIRWIHLWLDLIIEFANKSWLLSLQEVGTGATEEVVMAIGVTVMVEGAEGTGVVVVAAEETAVGVEKIEAGVAGMMKEDEEGGGMEGEEAEMGLEEVETEKEEAHQDKMIFMNQQPVRSTDEHVTL